MATHNRTMRFQSEIILFRENINFLVAFLPIIALTKLFFIFLLFSSLALSFGDVEITFIKNNGKKNERESLNFLPCLRSMESSHGTYYHCKVSFFSALFSCSLLLSLSPLSLSAFLCRSLSPGNKIRIKYDQIRFCTVYELMFCYRCDLFELDNLH